MPSISDMMSRFFDQSESEATSVTAFGEQNAPGINTTIAATTNLTAGTWDVTCYTNLSGTTAGLDRPNLAFKIGSTVIATILSTMGGVTDGFKIRVQAAGTAPVSVASIVASTAGSVYRVTIVADKVIA